MKGLVAVALAALLLPACASAYQDKPKDWNPEDPKGRWRYDMEGGYAAVGLMQSMEHFDLAPGVGADDSDPGFALRGGWRFTENAAVELGIESVTGFEVDAPPAGSMDVDVWNAAAVGKVYFLPGKIQPYALAGFGWTNYDLPGGDDGGAFVRLGAGVEFYVDTQLGFFLEGTFDRTTGPVKDLDRTNAILGMVVRF
jgi:opacity protein-like surface antigen